VGSRPRKGIWHLRTHSDVTEAVEARPLKERVVFYAIVEQLLRNPFDRGLGVRPVTAIPRPRIFSVPIQDNDAIYGVLSFEVYRDHPVVHLFWVKFDDL
jgi:hypothetical protein